MLNEEFTGVWATPQLVGRKEQLNQIVQLARQAEKLPRVIFVEGEGGIGKTRLLLAALEQLRSHNDICVARQLIDLYHVTHHTTDGFMYALSDVLPDNRRWFANYWRARDQLVRLRLAGRVQEIDRQSVAVRKAFTADVLRLAESHRLVWALDTLEKLTYALLGTGVSAEDIGSSWTWLCQQLPRWKNVVLILAGRQSANPLWQQLEAIQGLQTDRVPLAAFTAEETIEYFEAVTRLAETQDRQTYKRLQALPGDARQRAHTLSQGRPILLSLFVDFLSIAPADKLVEIPSGDIHLPDDLVRKLINRFRESGPIGDTVLALGRAPKGVDAEL